MDFLSELQSRKILNLEYLYGMYFVKAPKWLRWIYHSLVWKIPGEDKVLYLTFDDGPHPQATTFVLEQLSLYQAKASFFCIGKNVLEHPEIYDRIIAEGHRVGNHTQNHLNGWKVSEQAYLDNIEKAANYIHTNLFRPPYGRIKLQTIKKIKSLLRSKTTLSDPEHSPKIIMWHVLSGDFDERISAEKCFENVIKNAEKGSIIVFHDSAKAWERLYQTLPRVLEYYAKMGFQFESIPG